MPSILEPKSNLAQCQLIIQWLSEGGPTALSYFFRFCQIVWNDKLDYDAKLSALKAELGEPGKYVKAPPLELHEILSVIAGARNWFQMPRTVPYPYRKE